MHLPFEPNASNNDLIATLADMQEFLSGEVWVEEKIDGANTGITVFRGEPVIRNRTHILSKGYKKDTTSKKQFVPIWTWFYSNRKKFDALEGLLGFTPSVYGEWLYARHTLPYNQLPDLWIPYEIYDPGCQEFLSPAVTREALNDVGFKIPPLLGRGVFTLEQIVAFRDGPRSFADNGEKREGVCLKSTTKRYKMVAPWFKSDEDWPIKPLVQNKVKK